MEGVQVILYVSRDVWDEFHITSATFCTSRDHDNCIKAVGGSEKNDLRNYENDLWSSRNCDHRPCSYESCLKERLSRDSNYTIEGKTHSTQKVNFTQCYKTKMNGYTLSVFVRTLKSSEFYRSAVISHLLQCKNVEQNKYLSHYPLKLIIELYSPQRDIIDYSWNERMLTMAVEHRELDHAMSWLSTLGGAFSALGDRFDHCAVVAGRISIEQMRLALRLGDPMTVARCKLYLALSLLQRGYLRKAKRIIKEQYQQVTAAPVVDIRVVRMCQGIWAKLKYAYCTRRKTLVDHEN